MLKKITITILAIAGILLPVLSQEFSAKEFVENKISEFEGYQKRLLEKPSESEKNAIIQTARSSIMDMLEFDIIARLVLGKYYDQKTQTGKNQIKEFENLYKTLMTEQILKVNLPDEQSLKKKNPLKLIKESQKKDRIFNKDAYIVHSSMVRKKIDYAIDLYFYKKNSRFYLYDIRIDDNSTLLDYRNYFYRTIQTKGMGKLIQILKSKVQQLENGQTKKN